MGSYEIKLTDDDMRLLDVFAGQAMQAMLGQYEPGKILEYTADRIAEAAYAISCKMIAERKEYLKFITRVGK